MRQKPKRSVLRYHGGKWRLAPWIISHFPEHKIYVEPFCGAASVLLRKPRVDNEIINDLDGDVINLFRVLRDPEDSQQLQGLLFLTPFAREEYTESFAFSAEPVERARQLIVKSFMGFGGDAIYKEKNRGYFRDRRKGSSPPCKDWATYPEEIRLFCERLRGVTIEHRDAKEVMWHYDSEDTLFYVDPPYLLNTRTHGRAYQFEMTVEEHVELASFLSQCKGMIVISGYPSELYEHLYSSWDVVSRNAIGEKASRKVECLWISPRASRAMRQKSLGVAI